VCDTTFVAQQRERSGDIFSRHAYYIICKIKRWHPVVAPFLLGSRSLVLPEAGSTPVGASMGAEASLGAGVSCTRRQRVKKDVPVAWILGVKWKFHGHGTGTSSEENCYSSNRRVQSQFHLVNRLAGGEDK